MKPNALVVIPNRATFVSAWGLEEAVRLAKEYNVYFIDLSKFESRYLGIIGRAYWLVDNFAEKNNVRKVIRKQAKAHAIKLLPNRFGKVLENLALSDEEERLFESSLKATYARAFGSADIKITDLDSELVSREKFTYSRALDKVRALFLVHEINYLVTINGRGIIDSACVFVANEFGVKYGLVEISGESWDFYSVHETTTQSQVETQRKVEGAWRKDSTQFNNFELNRIAEDYFSSRLSPSNEWRQFQLETKILRINEPYVVFFPTSDHEFATVTLDADSVSQFRNQKEAFYALENICKDLSLKLVVRVHPHPVHSTLAVLEDKLWGELCRKSNSMIFESASGVNSLELARNAHASLTHRSTIGAELAWQSLPVGITGVTTFSNQIQDCQLFDEQSLRGFIQEPSVSKFRKNLVKWAFYMSRGEYPLRIFKIYNFNHIVMGKKSIGERRRWFVACVRFFARFKFTRINIFN